VTTAADVRTSADQAPTLTELTAGITSCRACPRLVEWRERVARERRKSFANQTYWGRPVPGFGVEDPAVLVVGLAPAAHGGNRTGRVFTGDRSGDWLFASMHRTGLANQATSTHLDDGLRLIASRVLAAVRCAPPANKPTTIERDTCAPWLDRELELVRPGLRVVVALGAFGWASTLAALVRSGDAVPSPRPVFGHGAEASVGGLTVLGCFHPSQQNTFTGRLTEPMIDAVMARAASLGGVITT
jgi:uracil-DNA glycosylase family 4